MGVVGSIDNQLNIIYNVNMNKKYSFKDFDWEGYDGHTKKVNKKTKPAHCTKCGELVKGDTNGICQNCI